MPLLRERGLYGAEADVLDEHGKHLVRASCRRRHDRLCAERVRDRSEFLARRPVPAGEHFEADTDLGSDVRDREVENRSRLRS